MVTVASTAAGIDPKYECATCCANSQQQVGHCTGPLGSRVFALLQPECTFVTWHKRTTHASVRVKASLLYWISDSGATMPSRPLRRAILSLLATTFTLAIVTSSDAAAIQPRSVPHNLYAMSCATYSVPVTVVQGDPESANLYGELCHRGPSLPSTVQLLVHGATYDHHYWEMPVADGSAPLYDYPLVATAAGYATFNVDRLGHGASSHLSSAAVTAESGAVALHSIITKLRSGWFAGHQFQKVIYVGHSYGSWEAWAELAMFHNDVDGAIITGALHHLTTFSSTAVANSTYPANQDPTFQDLNLDDGYFTTIPPSMNGGTSVREQTFYYAPTADPDVVAADEAHKDVVTSGEFNWLATYTLPPNEWPTQQMTLPVLTVVGQEDSLFCGDTGDNCTSNASLLTDELPYYPPQARLQAAVIPNSGHDIQLQESVGAFYAIALAWAVSHVAP